MSHRWVALLGLLLSACAGGGGDENTATFHFVNEGGGGVVDDILVKKVDRIEDGTTYFATGDLMQNDYLLEGKSVDLDVEPGTYFIRMASAQGKEWLGPDDYPTVDVGDRWIITWGYHGIAAHPE